MSLTDFETLVLTQQPASRYWTPVTDYSFKARKAIEGKHPQLIKDVFQPRRVLDVGCGPGHLCELLEALGVMANGCDLHVTRPSRFRQWDVTDMRDDVRPFHPGDQPDLVICREVLEHLTIRQIRLAVTNLCAVTTRYVYLTTRFHPNPASLLDVATSDNLDPTHISMLNQDLLRVLFVLEGFKSRPDLEARLDWQHKGRVLVYERT